MFAVLGSTFYSLSLIYMIRLMLQCLKHFLNYASVLSDLYTIFVQYDIPTIFLQMETKEIETTKTNTQLATQDVPNSNPKSGWYTSSGCVDENSI